MVDAKNITGEELTRIRINENVSDKHTFTSKWVSDLAGHVKSISEKTLFKTIYRKWILLLIKLGKTSAQIYQTWSGMTCSHRTEWEL